MAGGNSDPGVCGLRWCDETAGHAGPHRHRLFDGFAMDVAASRADVGGNVYRFAAMGRMMRRMIPRQQSAGLHRSDES